MSFCSQSKHATYCAIFRYVLGNKLKLIRIPLVNMKYPITKGKKDCHPSAIN